MIRQKHFEVRKRYFGMPKKDLSVRVYLTRTTSIVVSLGIRVDTASMKSQAFVSI